jgi:hypothetical protein
MIIDRVKCTHEIIGTQKLDARLQPVACHKIERVGGRGAIQS